MKNFKRGTALLLAVVMVVASCLVQAEGALWATNSIETGETVQIPVPTENIEEVVQEETENVIPQENESDLSDSVQKIEEVEIPASTQQTEQVEPSKDEIKEVVEEPQQEEPQQEEAVKEEQSTESKVKMLPVTFQMEVAGGDLSVWEEGQEKDKASFQNGTYVKDVKEGSVLSFDIKVFKNFEIKQIKDESGNVYEPVTVDGNTFTYNITVTKEQKITIEYSEVKKEEKTKKEESKNSSKTPPKTPEEKSTGTYKLYYYTLIPGKQWDVNENADRKWNGMGVGTISGVKAPSAYSTGTVINTGTETYPEKTFPDVVIDGKTYHYAENSSNNEAKDGYYTVEWIRTIVSRGANAGSNGYNETVPLGQQTYHKDGIVRLNEKEWYTATFKIQEPKERGYTIQSDFVTRVKEGFAESGLRKPSTGDRTVDGKKWRFDGWYLDPECVHKADFTGKITENTDYYGKYYLNEDALYYEGNGATGGQTKETKGDLHATVKVSENGFTRPGYKFTGWNTKQDGTGTSYKKGDNFQLTNGDDILYAQWEAQEATIQFEENGGTNVEDLHGKTDEKIENTTLPVTTREQYIFGGWYSNPDFTGEAIKTLPAAFPPGVTTYYAKWTRDTSKFKVLPYEGKYDGKAHTVSFDTSVLEEKKESLIYRNPETKQWQSQPVTYTNVTNGKVSVEVAVVDQQGTQIWTSQATVQIIPRNVILVSASDRKMYDGTELTNHTIFTSGDGFAEGENVICDVTGTQTNPGECQNTFTYKAESGTDLNNYAITKKEGTLTVTDRTEKYVVTIVPNGGKEKYDGTQKQVQGFVGEYEGKIPVKADNGVVYYVKGITAQAVGTNANTYPVKIDGQVVVTDRNGVDLTNQFKVHIEDASLVIEKRTVTLTSATDRKVYDGTELTNSEVIVTEDGWAKGEEATYNVTGSQTLVGKSKNTFTYELKKGVLASNYDITKKEGTLTITDREETDRYEIVVEANSNTGNIYDGTEKTVEGLKQTSFVVEGKTYKVEGLHASLTKKNVGTYDVVIKGKEVVRDEAGNDVTKQFHVKKVNGQLSIAKKPVIVTADSKTKQYGSENPELTYTIKGIVSTEKLEEVTTVPKLSTKAQVNSPKGEYPIVFDQKVSEAENYAIEYVNGTLTVKENDRVLRFKANDASQMYNGKELSNSKVILKEGTLAEGDYISDVVMTEDSSIINVGEQGNVISKVIIKNALGQNVTESYAGIAYEVGKLTVTPATIEVTIDSHGKAVNHTDPSLTYAVSKDSSVAGEKAAFQGDVEREKGEEVGTYKIHAGTLRLINNGAFLAENYVLKIKEGIFEIEDANYKVVKERTNQGTGKDGAFLANETVTFDITVQNNSEKYALENIVVEDVLENAQGSVTLLESTDHSYTVEGTKAIIAKLNSGQSVTIKATYVVTQADIDHQKEISNTALAQTNGTIPEVSEPVEVPLEKDRPDFQTQKMLTNQGTGEQGSFKFGETATFDIVVKNTGNVTLNHVTVREQLKGANILPGTGYTVLPDQTAIIDSLQIGETIVVKAEYQIKQADVDNGGAVNVVLVEGKGPGSTDPEPEKPKEEIPTDDKKADALVTKKLTNQGSAQDGSFKVGEKATFDIIVENIGNVTLHDVTVEEELKGAKIISSKGYEVNEDGTKATISEVLVGKKIAVKAEYIVTQEDVNNGGAKNIAAVKIPGKEDPQKPSEEIPTELQKPQIESEKRVTNQGSGADGTFKVGETAEFDIIVKNTGNVSLDNVKVKEHLAGAKIIDGDGYVVTMDRTEATIGKLEVQESVVIKAVYTITQEDIDQGGTKNTVTANGKGPGDKNPDQSEAEVIVPTDVPQAELNLNKSVISQPREDGEYRIGDTIAFAIVAVNTGNTTLNNITIKDMLNVKGQVTWEDGIAVNEENEAIIGSMKPGETVTLKCFYEVTKADAGKDIINAAVADSDEITETDPSITTPAKVEKYYNLTIHYVYPDGSTAAPSVKAQYLKGETFGYRSPEISGYTPDYAFVRSDANGMPANDYTFTVVYTANIVVISENSDNNPTEPEAQIEQEDFVEPVIEPVGAELKADTEGNVEVQEVVDEKVPLANRKLDDHACCILHFLLLLAAMIIYAFYTRSMKKHQKRIAELTDELEIELLKTEQGAQE